jgi:uncharacterized RDD family membrane protein YckC
MPYCRNCGAAVETGARYCPECGESIEDTVGSETQHEDGWGSRQEPSAQTQRGYDDQSAGRRMDGQTRRDRTAPGYSRVPDRDDTDVIGARIIAQIVDNVLMFVIFFGIFAVFSGFGEAAGSEAGFGLTSLGLLLAFGSAFFYQFFLEGYWDGYTVGKKLMGIKVVKKTGESCTYGSAFLRNVLEIVDSFFYYAVGFVAMAASDKRQRIGDRVAGTVVVREEPR